jgi:hypothetical protein
MNETNLAPDQAAPDTQNNLNDFISRMKMPKEDISAPEGMLDDTDEDTLTDSPGDLGSPTGEYRDQAVMAINILDSSIGMLGMMLSGQDAERYQKFARREPPEHYVKATARLIEKYLAQAAFSPEMAFLIIFATLYWEPMVKIMQDRSKARSAAQSKVDRDAAAERLQVKAEMKAEKKAAKELIKSVKTDNRQDEKIGQGAGSKE